MPKPPPAPSPNVPAIVLGGVAYGDRSRIVRALTADHGLVPLWVANASKDKALWHPMATLELADLKPGKGNGLWTAREWRRSTPQLAYRRSPERASVGFFVAEVLAGSLEEGAPTPEVHALALATTEWLESEPHVAWIHVKFMAELVHALGMMPEVPPNETSRLDIGTGEYVPSELAPKTALAPEVVKGMRDILGMEFAELERLGWSRARRKDLVLGAHRYAQAQLGKTRELKSYDVLEALFA